MERIHHSSKQLHRNENQTCTSLFEIFIFNSQPQFLHQDQKNQEEKIGLLLNQSTLSDKQTFGIIELC